MWGARYWGRRYWGSNFWGKGGAAAPPPSRPTDLSKAIHHLSRQEQVRHTAITIPIRAR